MEDPERRANRDFEKPISNDPNARLRNEPLGQTDGGLPDDSGKPVEITPEG